MASYRVRELQTEIVTGAEMFVQLSNDKVGESFLRYFKNAFFKFRSIVISQKDLNRDLKNIQIIDLSGRIQYDMELYEKGFFSVSDIKYTNDKFVLENIKKMEINIHTDNEVCIVAPYIDEYGVHNYSIIYYFSLVRLKKELSAVVLSSVLMGVSTIILSIILSIIASNRITGHLKVLTDAARKIARGDFNQLIRIKTGDEFEDLANAFNFMTEKIRDNIRELNNLIDELRKRDAQKTHLLANISHELRTPLTASIGYVDYMEKEKMGPLSQDQKHSLEIIRRNLERLNKEIHSLLLISKYTMEGIKLKPEEFDINELIDDVINNFTPEIKLKGLVIKKSIEAKRLYADKDNLRTVIENLINNSIKFTTPETEIIFKTDMINKENQEYFRFKISNYGATIPPDQVGKIFEPFYQVDATTSRKYGGIGLGLTIAQNIIEAHQGKIWAESKEGLTSFYFIIPQGGQNE
ncbi:MAG: HAMP domain-containing sensor histidine kinase [candidate division WOR-3 bacterium]